MTNFPVIEEASIENYLLYSRTKVPERFDLDFSEGPWIILGTNGLGKSTLLLILQRTISGPVQLRDAGFSGERSDLVKVDTRMFAVRVEDGAREATATVGLRLGKTRIVITRRLRDLALVNAFAEIGKRRKAIDDEEEYRAALVSAMGVARFEDALSVLERVTFFLEDRQPLMWNLAAQFELFRSLLTPSISVRLRQLEAEIVSADSFARGLNATLYRLTQRQEDQLQKHGRLAQTRARLAAARADVAKWEDEETKRLIARDECDERRTDARIGSKRAERDADESASTYEKIKFQLLRHSFAGLSLNEQYIFLKLASDPRCPVCGEEAVSWAAEIDRRRKENLCLVCGSVIQSRGTPSTRATLQRRAAQAHRQLTEKRSQQQEQYRQFREAEDAFRLADRELEGARSEAAQARRTARDFERQLPIADRAALDQMNDEISQLRRQVIRFRAERDQAEEKISSLLDELRSATEKIRGRLEKIFHQRARAFFAEEVRLVYAARKDRIGQGGRIFDLPAFEIEMTSGATETEFIRRNADQVSLSQREYLEIIFRLSVIETLSRAGCSIVIDGPEGSLDAVFAERAGDLFSEIGSRRGSNAILACNIIDGSFLPNALRRFRGKTGRRGRVVNLLEIAAPTAALSRLRRRYRDKLEKILGQRASK